MRESRTAAERVRESLREKETLLQEIHHRVKNNLQITSSLLKLQASRAGDERVSEPLRESQNRIRAMALVHEKLYRSRDLARVSFRDFAGSLNGILQRSYGVDPRRLRVTVAPEDALLDIRVAVPCGLILHELCSSAIKHAFPKGDGGEVEVGIRRRPEGSMELWVRDNGVGLPPDLKVETTASLGLKIVQTLTRQLRGQVRLETGDGTTVHIVFPGEPKEPA